MDAERQDSMQMADNMSLRFEEELPTASPRKEPILQIAGLLAALPGRLPTRPSPLPSECKECEKKKPTAP